MLLPLILPLVALAQFLFMPELFRFWSAFKDWKRGYTEPVERLTMTYE